MAQDQSILHGRVDRRTVLGLAASAGATAVAGSTGLYAAQAAAKGSSQGIPALVRLSPAADALSVQQRQAMVSGITRVLADVTGLGSVGMGHVTVLVA